MIHRLGQALSLHTGTRVLTQRFQRGWPLSRATGESSVGQQRSLCMCALLCISGKYWLQHAKAHSHVLISDPQIVVVWRDNSIHDLSDSC